MEQIASDVPCGTTEVNDYPDPFWTCFGLIPLYFPVCNFGMTEEECYGLCLDVCPNPVSWGSGPVEDNSIQVCDWFTLSSAGLAVSAVLTLRLVVYKQYE